MIVSADRGLGVTSHDMSVNTSDIKGFLRSVDAVKNIVSAPDSFSAADDRIAAVELLEESEKVSSVAPTARL
jgi:hypothetical protein